MKLLFDQNISFKIVSMIEDLFPGSKQVRDVDLENAKDSLIWRIAKRDSYCIVTFDSDFYDLSIVKGSPPKIIWLRSGNTTTKDIERLLRKNQVLIQEFLDNPDYTEISCLEIG